MKLTFSLKFLFIFLAIIIVEILIGKYLHDAFVRPFGGDVLVIILIYAFFRIFLKTNNKQLALGVLIFSFVIEFLQKANYVTWFGWENNKLMRTILGTSFSAYDLLAYFVGYLVVVMLNSFQGLSSRKDA